MNGASHVCEGFRSQLTRRELLRAGGLGLLGMSLPELLAARAQGGFGKAKACILLFMWGGPAQQDTWDMKPHAPAEFRGEFSPIPTKVPGIHISEHFPQLAQRTDKLCIVRSMTHSNFDHLSNSSACFRAAVDLPPSIRASSSMRELALSWVMFDSVRPSITALLTT